MVGRGGKVRGGETQGIHGDKLREIDRLGKETTRMDKADSRKNKIDR